MYHIIAAGAGPSPPLSDIIHFLSFCLVPLHFTSPTTSKGSYLARHFLVYTYEVLKFSQDEICMAFSFHARDFKGIGFIF